MTEPAPGQSVVLLPAPGAPGVRVTLSRCPLRVRWRGRDYVRVDDPDTGEFLGGYVRVAHAPCCSCCGGAGSDAACSGPCWDCRGTGHDHPLQVSAAGSADS